MGRFCNGLMTVFRVIQLILSVAALACGVFITYTMFSMADSARHIQTSIESLLNNTSQLASIEASLNISNDGVDDALSVLDDVLKPILAVLEGTPSRAIVLATVALWSVILIIYLLVAQQSKNHPKMNKRSLRITLELLTLFAWVAGIICAALLAIEYGSIIFSGGAELKLAWSVLRDILGVALKELFTGDEVSRELDIINDVFNVGATSILALVSSVICGIVSVVSLIASCCISGKTKTKKRTSSSPENGASEYMLPSSKAEKKGFTVSARSSPVDWMTPDQSYYSAHPAQGYFPVKQPYESLGRGASVERWGR